MTRSFKDLSTDTLDTITSLIASSAPCHCGKCALRTTSRDIWNFAAVERTTQSAVSKNICRNVYADAQDAGIQQIVDCIRLGGSSLASLDLHFVTARNMRCASRAIKLYSPPIRKLVLGGERSDWDIGMHLTYDMNEFYNSPQRRGELWAPCDPVMDFSTILHSVRETLVSLDLQLRAGSFPLAKHAISNACLRLKSFAVTCFCSKVPKGFDPLMLVEAARGDINSSHLKDVSLAFPFLQFGGVVGIVPMVEKLRLQIGSESHLRRSMWSSGGAPTISRKVLRSVFGNPKQQSTCLKSLRISAFVLDSKVVQTILNGCPELEDLRFSDHCRVREEGEKPQEFFSLELSKILRACGEGKIKQLGGMLTELSLRKNIFKAHDVQCLIEFCPNLRSLTAQFDDESLGKLPQLVHCVRNTLETLQLTHPSVIARSDDFPGIVRAHRSRDTDGNILQAVLKMKTVKRLRFRGYQVPQTSIRQGLQHAGDNLESFDIYEHLEGYREQQAEWKELPETLCHLAMYNPKLCRLRFSLHYTCDLRANNVLAQHAQNSTSIEDVTGPVLSALENIEISNPCLSPDIQSLKNEIFFQRIDASNPR